MTTAVAAKPTAWERQFLWATAQYIEARRRQGLKDGPANRMAVAQCRGLVDAVLDEYLAAIDGASGVARARKRRAERSAPSGRTLEREDTP